MIPMLKRDRIIQNKKKITKQNRTKQNTNKQIKNKNLIGTI